MIDDGQLLINFSGYNYSCIELLVTWKSDDVPMLNHR